MVALVVVVMEDTPMLVVQEIHQAQVHRKEIMVVRLLVLLLIMVLVAVVHQPLV
jgi:hypothetical protein